ncbi:MAG: alpha/beta fold hydrolase [Acidimicrobiales bacterium]
MTLAESTLRLASGLDARVFRGGDGPPLLYLHGGGGVDADEPMANALADAGFSVAAPLAPGFTDLDEIDELRDVRDLALHYDDVLAALGLGSTAVVGHSFGAMLAAELAAHYPARVSGLVLIAPLGLWNDAYPPFDLFSVPAAELNDYLWADPSSELAQAAAAQANPAGADLTDPAVVERIIDRTRGLITVAKYLWPIPDKGLARRLYRVAAPTLVLWGAKDRIAPPEYAEDFVRLIAGARAEILPDAGHLVTLEKQAEVVELIRRFLQ